MRRFFLPCGHAESWRPSLEGSVESILFRSSETGRDKGRIERNSDRTAKVSDQTRETGGIQSPQWLSSSTASASDRSASETLTSNGAA